MRSSLKSPANAPANRLTRSPVAVLYLYSVPGLPGPPRLVTTSDPSGNSVMPEGKAMSASNKVSPVTTPSTVYFSSAPSPPAISPATKRSPSLSNAIPAAPCSSGEGAGDGANTPSGDSGFGSHGLLYHVTWPEAFISVAKPLTYRLPPASIASPECPVGPALTVWAAIWVPSAAYV